jgi:GrpB-like predicted nucleotidyltransferase (UPF0157 family)
VQVTVHDLEQVDDTAFAREGFTVIVGLFDHCPPGLELTQDQLRKRFYRSTRRPANVHVRESGRFNQRYPLVCRDFLRVHPTSAGAYALIKQRLASRFPTDEEAYYAVKDPVFDIILDGANEWAKAIGWSEPPAD